MPYSIVTKHSFDGPAFYSTSGAYRWDVVNDETKKTVLSITDTAKISYNCYWEHVASPTRIKNVSIHGNIVSELLKDGTTYLYELNEDNVISKKVKVPTGWNSLVYSCKWNESRKFNHFVFKDGFYADLTIKSTAYIGKNEYNSYVMEFENSEVFDRYNLEKLYYVQIIYEGYYFVAKYKSSEIEISYGNKFYKNDSIDEILKCVNDAYILNTNIVETNEKMQKLLVTGITRTERCEEEMVKNMYEQYLSLSNTAKVFTFNPKNNYDIVSITVHSLNDYYVPCILTFKFADLIEKTYLVKRPYTPVVVYFKYDSEVKELMDTVNCYNELIVQRAKTPDLSNVIKVESFVELGSKRQRTK